jgi:hypothetical protein
MALSNNPGYVLRGALVTFGCLFLPLAGLFLYRDWLRYWPQALILAAVAIWFIRVGLSRNEDSWIAMIDELRDSDKK